MKVSAPLLN